MRLISILLFLAGLGVTGFVAGQYFGMWDFAGAQEDAAVAAEAEAPVRDLDELEAELRARLPEEAGPIVGAAPAPAPSRGGDDDDALVMPQFLPEPANPNTAVDQAEAGMEVMRELKSLPLDFYPPETMRLGETVRVSVEIKGADVNVSAIRPAPEGEPITTDVLVSDKVDMRLSGPAFAIESITPTRQTISPIQNNVWEWEVTSEKPGKHSLTLTIFALLGEEALPVNREELQVSVEVSRVAQVLRAAASANPLFVLLGGLGSLIAGFFGMARFFRGG